jgi:aminocarboxymuconate-semialdehyde decarboxylase
MIIDIYTHHSSKLIEEMIGQAKSGPAGSIGVPAGPSLSFPFPLAASQAESRLSVMDKYGIDVQVICQTAPGLFHIPAEEAAHICTASNSENYELCKAFPQRFVNVCILSLLDMSTAMDEFQRSIDELDCRGITLATNQNGKGLDSPEFFPLYEQMADHDLPLFLHPTNWESYPLADQVQSWGFMSTFGWPFDTTQALWRLIFGGVLDEFPTLKIVTHHMGAMLPFFAARAEAVYGMMRGRTGKDVSVYWNNIYGDTAMGGGTKEVFQLGYSFFGARRLVFGSDYPFGPNGGETGVSRALAGTRSIEAPAADVERILGENAKELLKIT